MTVYQACIVVLATKRPLCWPSGTLRTFFTREEAQPFADRHDGTVVDIHLRKIRESGAA